MFFVGLHGVGLVGVGVSLVGFGVCWFWCVLVLVLEEVLVMLVLLVFNANYVIDVTEIAEIVRKFKF